MRLSVWEEEEREEGRSTSGGKRVPEGAHAGRNSGRKAGPLGIDADGAHVHEGVDIGDRTGEGDIGGVVQFQRLGHLVGADDAHVLEVVIVLARPVAVATLAESAARAVRLLAGGPVPAERPLGVGRDVSFVATEERSGMLFRVGEKEGKKNNNNHQD